jgi:hypothetical protein
MSPESRRTVYIIYHLSGHLISTHAFKYSQYTKEESTSHHAFKVL